MGELNGNLGIGSKKVYDEKYKQDLNHIIFRNPELSICNKPLILSTNNKSSIRIFSRIRGKTKNGSRNIECVTDKDSVSYNNNNKLYSSLSKRNLVVN